MPWYAVLLRYSVGTLRLKIDHEHRKQQFAETCLQITCPVYALRCDRWPM